MNAAKKELIEKIYMAIQTGEIVSGNILLPDATDLESLQLIRIGGTKYVEQFWDHQGYALRQPAVAVRGEARDFTDIATELARRTGLLEKYNAAQLAGWTVLRTTPERLCSPETVEMVRVALERAA